MVGRLVVAVLIGPVSALAAVGALTLPGDVLFGWILLGAGAGLLVAFGASRLRQGRETASGPDLPVGAATAAAFVTAGPGPARLLAAGGGAPTPTRPPPPAPRGAGGGAPPPPPPP